MESLWIYVLKLFSILLTVCSFVPQYLRIISSGTSTGVSPYYALFTTAVATEQLNLLLDLAVCADWVPETVMHDPPTLSDWLNLAQMGVHWACTSALVLLIATYSSSKSRTASIMAIWTTTVATVLIPCVLQYAFGLRDVWGRALYKGVHLFYLNPAFTVLAVAVLFPQIRTLKQVGAPGALSPLTLLLQAILYTVLAVSWVFRITDPDTWQSPRSPLASFAIWWGDIGWAAIDHAIFAAVQGILYLKCVQLGEGAFVDLQSFTERSPLLKPSVRDGNGLQADS